MELDNLNKISKLQDDLIASLSKNVDLLLEVKELKHKVNHLLQIEGAIDASTPAPDGIPRRSCLWLAVPAEKAISRAMSVVESMPADTRLTEAVILLEQARNKVSDYIDNN